VDPLVALAGFAVGTIVGISGVGGSALLAPLLVLVMGVPPVVAVGTDLVYGVPTKLLAAFAHARQGTVDRGVARWLILGGVPGALFGLAAFAAVRAHMSPAQMHSVVRHCIGIAILCACAAFVVLRFVRRPDAPAAPGRAYRPAVVVAIGFAVGLVVALTSIGAGSLTLPLLLLAVPGVTIRRLIGAEIVLAAAIVPVAALGYIGFGDVDWRLSANLLIGSLPGVWLGCRLCALVSQAALQPLVIGLLAYAGVRLL
jgi:uncharacterized membrane protein YfcA